MNEPTRPDLIKPCTCSHPMRFHTLTTTPPRKHKACGVYDQGGRCACRQYTPEVKA